MSVKVHSYISFNGNAAEAMAFYKSVFDGEVYSDTFEKFASADMPVADEDKNKIMHAFLQGDSGIELMGADTPTGMGYTDEQRISLALNGDDEELLSRYWDNLADGGHITVPFEKSPWGDMFGMLKDKYGVEWMVNLRASQEGGSDNI